MKTLDDFIRKEEPNRRTSKLQKFDGEIHKLYTAGFRIEQIQKFLRENKIKVSQRHIWRYIKLNKTLSKKSFSLKTPPASLREAGQKNFKQESKSMKAFLKDIDQTVESMQQENQKGDTK